MKIIVLGIKPSFAFIIFVFKNPNSLPKIAVDVLDPPLAFPIVNNHLNSDLLIWEVKYFVNVRLNLNIEVWFKTAQTS
jgi:hypothetical protein